MTRLPDTPAKHFRDAILKPNWDASVAKGFDPNNSTPTDDEFLPTQTSINNVGAVYPSLIIQFSNETSGGESTYDAVSKDGPVQFRSGTLLAIARAEDGGREYTGDSNQYSAEPAEDIVVDIIDAVEDACRSVAAGQSSEFQAVGSQRGPDAPDDTDVNPPVRIANCQVQYTYIQR